MLDHKPNSLARRRLSGEFLRAALLGCLILQALAYPQYQIKSQCV
jgi:hypothetical protein